MAEALIFLFLSLSVFLILTEIVTVDLVYGISTSVQISLNVFALKFTKSKERDVKPPRRKRRFPARGAIYRILSVLIPRSEIHVRELSLGFNASDPASYALRRGFLLLFISPLLAFAEKNAGKFTADNITLGVSEHNNHDVRMSISIRISLLDIIIGLLSALTSARRSYGRKQNE